MELDALFDRLWKDYAALTPQAEAIKALFESRGERVVNDHVALRTFAHPKLGIDRMASPLVALGYRPFDEYHFEEKHLFARAYVHGTEEERPKVFVSELLVDRFSPDLKRRVENLVEQVSTTAVGEAEHLVAGRAWSVDRSTYEALAKESEYAAWVAAFGFCANHFTVLVNRLNSFDHIEEVARFIQSAGYELNVSGGVIKGSPEVLLEQCSTKAARISVAFDDGQSVIPSCYYEFARRYPNPSGRLYQGFVAASADRIFESTNR